MKLKPHTPFLPPSREGSIIFPGFDGGAEWGGAAADPDGVLYVNGNGMAWVLNMVETKKTGGEPLASGEAIFMQICAAGHGIDRKGNVAQNVPTLLGVERKLKKADVLALLKTGRGMMPSFAFLSERQQDLVADHVLGGGWQDGGRLSGLTNMLPEVLKQGISVVSVEYRFINEATADGVVPPVKGPLHDAARALQLVRSKAREWNIDKERIGASGGSAGACTSLWLAFHPDLADPKSNDPVSRESTRLWCAAVTGAQTTLDPQQMKDWTPNSTYGGHAFGFKGDAAAKLSPFSEFLAKRDTILPWIAEYSPYALVTSDDPPIYLHYGAPPALGKDEKDPTHTSNFGVKLQEHCKASGVACELFYPGAADTKHASVLEYLLEKLKATGQ